MKYEVRQLSLGEILDQAISILKNRFGLLIGINLVLLVPYQIIAGIATLSVMPVLPAKPTQADAAAYQHEIFSRMPILLAISLLFFVIIWPLTNAAITFAVASEYLGHPITIGGAWRRAFQIAMPFLGTAILFGLFYLLGMIPCGIAAIFFYFWWALWPQIVVIEGIAGSAALKRSHVLMKGNYLTLFVLVLIVGVINALIGSIANFVPEPYVRSVVAAIVQGALFSFAGAAHVVFYFSCRCKVENFDLVMLADLAAEERPAGQ